MGAHDHKKHALKNINFAVITISDTRSEKDDKSGSLIKQLLQDHNHTLGHYSIIKDDKEEIVYELKLFLTSPNLQAIIFNGGTGISKRDVTIESVTPYLEKLIPGFGELFRNMSVKEIGSAAMMSRALAGITGEKAVFCIPGSTGAVNLAMNELILKECGHILWELSK